ncbi:MAG: FeoB-associated Cys-rich membrane protein [Acutalibacteraceae bacterium]
MNIYDYIILSVVAVLLVAAVIFIIKRSKSGRHFCGGDCKACGLCDKKHKKGDQL